MKVDNLVDHLFRHQYGKMVAILTRIFGLSQLELIEDAIQDTFSKALLSWRNKMPDNPEAWLTKAAKNRAIDLLRSAKAQAHRMEKLDNGPSALLLEGLFLEKEIKDSQLRMIFTACHPALNPGDQIAFALKTISGFGTREIAAALLTKEETIKKRISRSRKTIIDRNIQFEIPNHRNLPSRIKRVLEVIYLIFNEGFHSTAKHDLIREELCTEALRLCQLMLKRAHLRTSEVYALFALLCFHTARLESKLSDQGEIINFKDQDRSTWYWPSIQLGHSAMMKAVESEEFSTYHYEAAIAAEHLKAPSLAETNWANILKWYSELYKIQPTPLNLLNQGVVLQQMGCYDKCWEIIQQIDPDKLEQRKYLYYSACADLALQEGNSQEAICFLDQAIARVHNKIEKKYFLEKRNSIVSNNQ
ncbi:MAG: sigma-70 family RNA polymerase sigma factor [Saprospiraceae bacterium]|nr:sigma-70 family RNA polymerase sigma factor [Saprospiraceae bacterium]